MSLYWEDLPESYKQRSVFYSLANPWWMHRQLAGCQHQWRTVEVLIEHGGQDYAFTQCVICGDRGTMRMREADPRGTITDEAFEDVRRDFMNLRFHRDAFTLVWPELKDIRFSDVEK